MSFVENTLPPGYRLHEPQVLKNGVKYDTWQYAVCTLDDFIVSGDFDTREACCRAAWRHWTTALLSRYNLTWSHTVFRVPFVWTLLGHRHTLAVGYTSLSENPKDLQIFSMYDGHVVTLHVSADLDEALARFASILFGVL